MAWLVLFSLEHTPRDGDAWFRLWTYLGGYQGGLTRRSLPVVDRVAETYAQLLRNKSVNEDEEDVDREPLRIAGRPWLAREALDVPG